MSLTLKNILLREVLPGEIQMFSDIPNDSLDRSSLVSIIR